MEFLEYLLMLSPLFAGVVLSQILKLKLKEFQALYAVLLAAAVAISYFVFGTGYITPLIIGAVGFIVMFILVAFFGKRIKTSTYFLTQAGVGFFPWTMSLTGAIIYAVILALFATLLALKPKFKSPFRRTGTYNN